MPPYFHPETGELITTHEEFLDALHLLEERLAPIYRYRARIREAMAERFPPAELPAKRYRTDKQQLVARCPRCGGRIESEGAASK